MNTLNCIPMSGTQSHLMHAELTEKLIGIFYDV